jgi:hypothetical protein
MYAKTGLRGCHAARSAVKALYPTSRSRADFRCVVRSGRARCDQQGGRERVSCEDRNFFISARGFDFCDRCLGAVLGDRRDCGDERRGLRAPVVNAVGLVAAAIVGYTIALRTSKLLDIEANVARLPAWARHFRLGSWQFLLTVRIIPGLGGTIATQTAAALRVPLFRHVWTMCAIAVPICTLLAVTGNGLANVLEARVVVPTKKYFYDHRQHQRISPSPTASQP